MRAILVAFCLCWAVTGLAEAPRFPARFVREYDVPGESEVRGVTFIANSNKFAATDTYGTLSVWDSRTGQRLKKRTNIGFGSAVASTPDGKSLVIFEKSGDLAVIDSETLETKKTIALGARFDSAKLAVSPDGTRVLIAGSSTKVVLVDLVAEKIVGNRDRVGQYNNFVGFSKDGKQCLFGGQAPNGAAPCTLGERWDPEKDESIFRWQFPRFGSAFGMWDLPDGRWAGVGGNPSKLILWDSKTKQELPALDVGGPQNAHSVDGNRVIVTGWSGEVMVFDLSRKEPFLGSFQSECKSNVVALNADGTELILGTWDTAVLHFKLQFAGENGEAPAPVVTEAVSEVREFTDDLGATSLIGHRAAILQIVPLPDSRHLVTTGFDNRVLLWDLDTKKVVERTEGTKAFSLYFGAAVSPDGKKLLLSGGQSKGQENLSLWDISPLKKQQQLDGLTDRAWKVAFSPDGSHVAAAGKEVHLWDVATGKQLSKFDPGPGRNGLGVFALEFDAAGKNLIYSHNDSLYRQPLEGKEEVRQQKLGQVQAIRRRPNSDEIAVETGRSLLFLKADTLAEIRRWELLEHVDSIHFSADGKRLGIIGHTFSQVMNIDREESLYVVQEPYRRFLKGCLTPDGKKLIIADRTRFRVVNLPQ